MMKVTRTAVVAAAPEAVWAVVSSVGRLPEWLEFAESAETLEGEATGRLQRIHGHWGRRRSEVDQRIVAWDPPRRFAWRHEAERLDGRPSPQFARETRFELRAEPGPVAGASTRGTRVTLESVQVPASIPKGLLMRLFGGRELGRGYERSLQRLSTLVTAPASPR
jgi:Polyketide cyclase / dehydrase and lipid transport